MYFLPFFCFLPSFCFFISLPIYALVSSDYLHSIHCSSYILHTLPLFLSQMSFLPPNNNRVFVLSVIIIYLNYMRLRFLEWERIASYYIETSRRCTVTITEALDMCLEIIKRGRYTHFCMLPKGIGRLAYGMYAEVSMLLNEQLWEFIRSIQKHAPLYVEFVRTIIGEAFRLFFEPIVKNLSAWFDKMRRK